MVEIMMKKGLFVIYAWIFTGDEIGEQSPGKLKLPTYCVRQDTGKLDMTEYYLQWGASGKDKYILFEMDPVDELLKEEVINTGIESVFKDVDLNKLFKGFDFNKCGDRYIPTAHYVTIEIIYECHYGAEGDEWDMHFGELEHITI
jgi:hypothetical protein